MSRTLTVALVLYLIMIGAVRSEISLFKSGQHRWAIEPKIRVKGRANLGPINTTGMAPDIKIDVIGTWAKHWGLNTQLKFDYLFSRNNKSDHNRLLYTAFIWTEFDKLGRLKIGQMKVPFGQEFFMSKLNRPYLSHSRATREIGPGVDLGVALDMPNIIGKADVELGLFNALGTRNKAITFDDMRVVGKVSSPLALPWARRSRLGYSLLYEIETNGATRQTFGQSMFGTSRWNIGKHKIQVFAEYIEKRFHTSTFNQSKDWAYGFFTAVKGRLGALEPYMTYEFLEPNSRFAAGNDQALVAAGLNIYMAKTVRYGLHIEEDTVTGYLYAIL